MGTSIYAMSGLSPADQATGQTWLYDNPEYPGRAEPFASGDYTYHAVQHMLAHSYGNYSRWRNQLAELAGYASAADAWGNHSGGPFWELINFSDCQGTLGTLVCAKLAQDFAQFQAAADAHPDEYFRADYNSMRAGFELAATDGAVKIA